ncbi:hypothetical protein GCM10010253_22470 [Streptomyces badius]|uniref:Uncharacterized protein n=1 Tax=Streptomyces badius TaxID=1941 RepID=A0ABQ2T2W7_STRBA|nr:hypothetical protein GCM10010253_22470 [Streptomyces badius]
MESPSASPCRSPRPTRRSTDGPDTSIDPRYLIRNNHLTIGQERRAMPVPVLATGGRAADRIPVPPKMPVCPA